VVILSNVPLDQVGAIEEMGAWIPSAHVLPRVMTISEAIEGRASVRAFQDRPVPVEKIQSILRTARWAPSGTNIQPWQVAVTSGKTKNAIGDRMIEAIKTGKKPDPDYQYYPLEFTPPYKARRIACGKALYEALDIKKEDLERREEQWHKNYHGFGAPVELFIFIEAHLEKGSWIDVGMFIQNILLAARDHGLETCPQAAFAEYPGIVRAELRLPDSMHLVCGVALGYPDREHVVNQYRTEREDVDTFTSWFLDE
jgi:nitroreductase